MSSAVCSHWCLLQDLFLYLLQLVQALKYENFEEIKEGHRLLTQDDTPVSRKSSVVGDESPHLPR